MRITSQDSTHWYTYSGEPVFGATLRDARKQNLLPGVTAILRMWPSDGLRNWLRSQDIMAAATTPRLLNEPDDAWVARVLVSADEASQKGRDTGKHRHDLVQRYHKGETLNTLDPFIAPYIDWCQKHVKEVRAVESIIVNRTHGYGGTLDTLVTLNDGRNAILDLKNRRKAGIYDSDGMQIAAYARAWMEQTGQDWPALVSVVLGTDTPEIKVQEWLPREFLWESFLLCNRLWQASKNYYPKPPEAKAA